MKVEANGFLRLFHCLFVLTHVVVITCQIEARVPLARVGLFPQLKRFEGFIHISDHVLVISRRDIELLGFAHALSQFERLCKRFSGAVSLSGKKIRFSQILVSRSEIRVKLNGALMKRNGFVGFSNLLQVLSY